MTGKVRVNCYAVSADGYGAGPDQSLELPLGRGGEGLHRWFFPTRSCRENFGQTGGEEGIDDDFGRGKSAYDRYYGDPSVVPNPNLGPLEQGPFTAYRVVIGDLGTKGGVLTDEHARALREDGSVIEGLYAAGNNSASVMGRTYPGPGSTIGPAAVFGLRGARHMAGRAADLVGAGATATTA